MIKQYSIERLDKEHWKTLRMIRLEALSCEPQSFGSSYKKESGYDEIKWREFIGEHRSRAIFTLKDGSQTIGLTGIIRSLEKPDEGILIASYIRREYRGIGLSRILYEARINWAKAENLSAIIVSHRESNLASKMANQKFGFQYTGQQNRIWADGLSEMELFYRLSLC